VVAKVRARVTVEQPNSSSNFEPERYWSERLGETFSLAGVGWLGLGESFNRWMYAVRRRVFRRTIRGLLKLDAARVLDVGSGTGFYVKLWRELGVSDITGSDLTAVAVERLRLLFPALRFEQVDISQKVIQLDGPFDAISAMDVLFHVVDDDAYEQALHNLAMLLTPGGRLIFTENLLHGETQSADHQTSRSLRHVEALLRKAGLELELRRPMFVLMNTPVDSDSGLLQRSWTAVTLLVSQGPRWAYLVGCVLYPLEVALTTIFSEGPSTEIVVCRRAVAPSSDPKPARN
jgi:SAM-dependent methyltransferase